ncbi:putative heavy metal transport/detoxification protein [Octadecabacter antarcticus 307]|uniref:Putative heavy metal transport/detoxification protein n=1 Tax=Octadecabacter antarcticus 307 TaxID=391626 RepID=M9R779_9RHOB|nr:heavy-metal-associated domain-containing protein [Octadecabacter antarcticus]AGI68479.1 putative heavy metal transport/detoxification protein [Octadecabacter antarcticus 307]
MQFHIKNMSCGGCAKSVIAEIRSVDAKADIATDPPNRKVVVTSNASRAELEAVLEEAGYPAASAA